jgi:rRNA maturation endonuclease Nob1
MLAVILLTIGLLGIGVAGISIKLLLKKDGKFAGTCSSNNPLINKDGEACGLCGARPEEKCQG